MLEFSLIAVIGALGAALVSRRPISTRFVTRTLVGVVIVFAGVFTTIAYVSGAGWGWSDLTQTQLISLLVMGGIGTAVSNSLFGWIASGRFSAATAGVLLATNVAVMLIPVVVLRLILFALTNFFFLYVWLTIRDNGVDA